MWEFGTRPARGPKPSLSLEQIVDRAIEIADAEGLEAVSMRRVASDLGVGTMSLYRYIPGKAELLDLMLDRVIETHPQEELPSDWRAAIEALGRGFWRLYVDHPWLPFVDQTRPVLGPNALLGLETVLAAFDGTGLTDQQKIMVVDLLDTFVSGVARANNNAALAEARTGVSAEEFWQAQEPLLTKAMGSGMFPRITGLADNAFSGTGETMLEFGLGVLVEGLDRLVLGT
jgi:AcrR family transcriptional regulator